MTDPTRRLVRELLDLRSASRMCAFEIATGDLTTTLVVAEGNVVRVTASKPSEALGRILVRKSLLTQDQYIDVLERMSAALAVGAKIRFGEIAVELGYVSADAVRTCLSEQLRLLACRVFQGASPTWTTRTLDDEQDAARTVTLSVEALFLDAVRWVDDARKDALALGEAREASLEACWELEDIVARFDLTESEAAFVREALSGRHTLRDLLDGATPPESVDTHAVLTALLATGAATAGPAPDRAATLRPSPNKGPAATEAEWAIDAAGAKSALAKIVLARVNVAQPADDASSSLEQQLRSEQAFQRGKELLHAGRTEAAAAEFERARQLKPESAEFALFTSWAQHAAREDALSPEATTELEARALAALRENAKLAFGHFVLGEVRRGTDDVESSRQFRHALRLEPSFFAGTHMKRFGAPPATRAAARGGSSARIVTHPSAPSSGAELPEAEATASAEAEEPPAAVAVVEPAAAAPERVAPITVTTPGAMATPPHAANAAHAAHPANASAKRRRVKGLLVLLGAVVALAGGALLALNGAFSTPSRAAVSPPTPKASPPPRPAASATAAAAASASKLVAAPADSAAAAAASAAPVTTGVMAATEPTSSTRADAGPGATRGVILLPTQAADHRVFIDRRAATVADGRVTAPCGRHELRIGSQGRPVSVDVPCGGEVSLP